MNPKHIRWLAVQDQQTATWFYQGYRLTARKPLHTKPKEPQPIGLTIYDRAGVEIQHNLPPETRLVNLARAAEKFLREYQVP